MSQNIENTTDLFSIPQHMKLFDEKRLDLLLIHILLYVEHILLVDKTVRNLLQLYDRGDIHYYWTIGYMDYWTNG